MVINMWCVSISVCDLMLIKINYMVKIKIQKIVLQNYLNKRVEIKYLNNSVIIRI